MDVIDAIITYAFRDDIGEVVKKTESDLMKIANDTSPSTTFLSSR